MAYRFEKNDSGKTDLVIDGFENGIAVSPYKGIANIRNLNTSYYPGVAYSNYRRQLCAGLSSSTPQVIDYYSESNYNSNFSLYAGGSQQYIAQKFYSRFAHSFTQAKFYLSKTGSPTGNITATLYSSIAPSTALVETLVVAGGGGGGTGQNGTNSGGGGGGAGGYKYDAAYTVSVQAYSVTVGNGGNGGAVPNNTGSDGANSVFDTLTATGGGGGGARNVSGRNGGSGGGAGGTSGSPGTGTAGQGNDGGTGTSGQAGGGGGAGAAGSNATAGGPGSGGAGIVKFVTGLPVTYSAGGAGGVASPNTNGANGTANTGNGGGGGSGGVTAGTAGNGGSGVVIISYPTGTLTATGGTITTYNGRTIHSFTSNGTFTVTAIGTTTSVVSSSTVAISGLTTTPTLTTFAVASTALSANTYYWIGLSYTGGDASNKLNVGYGITDEYPNTTSIISTNGTTWSNNTSPAANTLIYYVLYPYSASMKIPVQKATSPVGLNYVLDTSGYVWKQTAVNSNQFDLLGPGGGRYTSGAGGLAYWNNYLVVIGSGAIEFCGDGTGDSGVISSNWNQATGTATRTQAFTAGYVTSDTTLSSLHPTFINVTYPLVFQLGDPVQFTTTGTLPTGLSPNTTYYITYVNSTRTTFQVSNRSADTSLSIFDVSGGSTSLLLNDAWPEASGVYGIQFDNGDQRQATFTNGSTTVTWTTGLGSATTTGLIAVYIQTTDAGTGTHTIQDLAMPAPLGNSTSFNFTGMAVGATTLTITSYVNPVGKTVNNTWQEATGTYNIVDAAGHNILAAFTNGSSSVALESPITEATFGGSGTIQLLNPSATDYKTWVSKVDGNLYFGNGRAVGRILAQNQNTIFNPSDTVTFTVNYAVTELLQPNDTVADMCDLQNNLILAGKKDVYVWDYVSATPSAPAPVGEDISSIINILNNIYVFAGQKGNIYISNGYSAQLLYKMPDFIAGVIDPVWAWGDIMFHRSKLYFQALAYAASGTKILQGVFSLIVSAPSLQEASASGLVLEGQNSSGLVPSTTESRGALMDNEPSASGNDSYYSAWGSGTAGAGGIDYNDASLWQNFEPVIETDVIAVGTNLRAMTFGQVEYKLDRPLASDDQIRLSFRKSLTDSYTTIGTSTSSTATLSENFISNVTVPQWVQFKVEFACASSNSSFIPLREIRIHFE